MTLMLHQMVEGPQIIVKKLIQRMQISGLLPSMMNQSYIEKRYLASCSPLTNSKKVVQ